MASTTAAAGLTWVPPASADQLTSLQAQAQAVAQRIQDLGRQEAALGEQFDAAQLGVQQAQAKVAAAKAQVAAAEAATAKARRALAAEAVDAYTGQANVPVVSGAGSLGAETAGLLGAEYVETLAVSQTDALDQYRLAAVQAHTAEATLQQAQSAAQAKVGQLDAARTAVAGTQSQLQGVYHQEQGQIATLVAQIQAQQAAAAAAAAARAAAARAAAAAAAQQAAAQQAAAQQAAAQQAAAQAAARQAAHPAAPAPAPAAPPAPRLVSTPAAPPPPPGHGADGAVQAALSRVGDPYVWGAAGPNSFDCSGLIMWSYAQVGISLPHFSGAQYADGVKVPMSDLQPGDLVFPSNPGEHVAMYIGGGQIVEAPYTGADVHVVALSSWFVQAVRIA